MLKQWTLAGIAAFALAACDTPIGTELARDQAKSTVKNVVTDKYPGVDPSPVTDCIIDNSSGSEIVKLAGAAVTGVTDKTANLVLEIATRKDSLTCFVDRLGPLALAEMTLASQ